MQQQKPKCESRIKQRRCRRIARWKGYEAGPRGEGSIKVCTECRRDHLTLTFKPLEES